MKIEELKELRQGTELAFRRLDNGQPEIISCKYVGPAYWHKSMVVVELNQDAVAAYKVVYAHCDDLARPEVVSDLEQRVRRLITFTAADAGYFIGFMKILRERASNKGFNDFQITVAWHFYREGRGYSVIDLKVPSKDWAEHTKPSDQYAHKDAKIGDAFNRDGERLRSLQLRIQDLEAEVGDTDRHRKEKLKSQEELITTKQRLEIAQEQNENLQRNLDRANVTIGSQLASMQECESRYERNINSMIDVQALKDVHAQLGELDLVVDTLKGRLADITISLGDELEGPDEALEQERCPRCKSSEKVVSMPTRVDRDIDKFQCNACGIDWEVLK